MQYVDRLDTADWVLIGYIIGVGVVALFERLGESSGADWSPSEQTVVLDEDHLRRVEDGDTLRVERWHGHDLVLNGTVVLDAERVADSEGGENGE